MRLADVLGMELLKSGALGADLVDEVAKSIWKQCAMPGLKPDTYTQSLPSVTLGRSVQAMSVGISQCTALRSKSADHVQHKTYHRLFCSAVKCGSPSWLR